MKTKSAGHWCTEGFPALPKVKIEHYINQSAKIIFSNVYKVTLSQKPTLVLLHVLTAHMSWNWRTELITNLHIIEMELDAMRMMRIKSRPVWCEAPLCRWAKRQVLGLLHDSAVPLVLMGRLMQISLLSYWNLISAFYLLLLRPLSAPLTICCIYICMYKRHRQATVQHRQIYRWWVWSNKQRRNIFWLNRPENITSSGR